MPTLGEWIQFVIAAAIGCVVYAAMEGETARARTIAALVCGFFGMRAILFLYVWIRYGWKAARSMSMTP